MPHRARVPPGNRGMARKGPDRRAATAGVADEPVPPAGSRTACGSQGGRAAPGSEDPEGRPGGGAESPERAGGGRAASRSLSGRASAPPVPALRPWRWCRPTRARTLQAKLQGSIGNYRTSLYTGGRSRFCANPFVILRKSVSDSAQRRSRFCAEAFTFLRTKKAFTFLRTQQCRHGLLASGGRPPRAVGDREDSLIARRGAGVWAHASGVSQGVSPGVRQRFCAANGVTVSADALGLAGARREWPAGCSSASGGLVAAPRECPGGRRRPVVPFGGGVGFRHRFWARKKRSRFCARSSAGMACSRVARVCPGAFRRVVSGTARARGCPAPGVPS